MSKFPFKFVPGKAGNDSKAMPLWAFCVHERDPVVGEEGGDRKKI